MFCGGGLTLVGATPGITLSVLTSLSFAGPFPGGAHGPGEGCVEVAVPRTMPEFRDAAGPGAPVARVLHRPAQVRVVLLLLVQLLEDAVDDSDKGRRREGAGCLWTTNADVSETLGNSWYGLVITIR